MLNHRISRLTKIVSSIGPSTEGENYYKAFNTGADIFRYNFSHEGGETLKIKYDEACKIEKELNLRVSKFADLQGPKHRIGKFKDGETYINTGEKFRLDLLEELGNGKRVKLPHPELFQSLIKGTTILINDGQIKLEVAKKEKDFIDTKVIIGGKISDHKGFNIPNILIETSCITEKDKIDIEDAINIGFKLIVVSFIQTPEDLLEAKKIINNRAKIISKLEKPLVMENLEKIISLSDAIMIGRGDFAVEASDEIIPVYQRRIIRECIRQNKAVIIATQMLETMIDNPFPTRAEVSDIATSVYQCTDCTMLSGETTIGNHPDLSIEMMAKVIKTLEAPENNDILFSYVKFNRQFTNIESSLIKNINDLLSKGAKALILLDPPTELIGKIAKMRLRIPFFPIFDDEQKEQLARLYFGCNPILIEDNLFDDFLLDKTRKQIAKGQNILEKEVLFLIS
ncbi:UNVERIFIED_CONTAM: hypothetical protein GTU68_039198 [Idotea baltica]|nr:hypothetical protein [Idotea baltica]